MNFPVKNCISDGFLASNDKILFFSFKNVI